MKPMETAWFYFGVRALQAIAIMKQPAYALLKNLYPMGPCTFAGPRTSELPTQMTPNRNTKKMAISTMRKTDLQQELSVLGYDVEGATVAQMKEVLKVLRTSQEVETSATVIRGLGAMKRSELEVLSKQKGFPTGGTCDAMRLNLSRWNASAACSSGSIARPPNRITGDDMVTFGKFTGWTYREVLKSNRNNNYATWVINTSESYQLCSPELTRLARYLSANGIHATALAPPQDQPAVMDIEIEQELEQEIDAEYYQVNIEDEQMSTTSQMSSRFRSRNAASAARR